METVEDPEEPEDPGDPEIISLSRYPLRFGDRRGEHKK